MTHNSEIIEWLVRKAASSEAAGGSCIGITLHEQDGDIIFIEIWVDQRFQNMHRSSRIISQSIAQTVFGISPGNRIGKSIGEKKEGAARRKNSCVGCIGRFGK